MFLIFVLYAIFTGLIFVQSDLIHMVNAPFFIIGVRSLMSAGMLLLAHMLWKRSLPVMNLNMKQWFSIALYSIFLYGIGLVCFIYALFFIDGVTGCFIFATSPFITALILYLTENEKLSNKKALGLFLGFLSLIPIIFADTGDGTPVSEHFYLGIGLFALATLSYSYGWILAGKAKKEIGNQSELLITGWGLVISGTIVYVLHVLTNGMQMYPEGITPYFMKALLLFSLGTAVSYYLYMYLLKFYSLTFMSFATFLEPAYGMFVGMMFYNKPITFVSIGAFCVLVYALYLFYQEEL